MLRQKKGKVIMEEKPEVNKENNIQENESIIQPNEEITEKDNFQQTKSLEEQVKLLEEKVRSLETEVENYKDKFLRKAAEFENFKRRNENDQLNLIKYAAESFIIKLLPIVDDFERSLVHIKDAKDFESIKNGISLVYDKLMKVLIEQGVKPIQAIGKPFDVHYHEAIMQKKVDNVEPHTIVEEFEKGYIYKDRVIRHSKVAVSEDNHSSLTEPEEDKKNNSGSDSE